MGRPKNPFPIELGTHYYDKLRMQFPLDTSSYTTSNGVFTVTYGEKFSEDDSAFFSLSIKDYRY